MDSTKLTELAWSQDDQAEEVVEYHRNPVPRIIALAALIGSALLLAVMAWAAMVASSNDSSSTTSSGVPPVSQLPLPLPPPADSVEPQDNSSENAALNNNADHLDDTATRNADFIAALKRGGWTVQNESEMAWWGHKVCEVIGQQSNPSSTATQAGVALQFSQNRQITIEAAESFVATAVVVLCPQYS